MFDSRVVYISSHIIFIDFICLHEYDQIGDGDSDNLPSNICDGCVYKCCAWQSFKQQCEQSEQTLRNHFGNKLKDAAAQSDSNDHRLALMEAEATSSANINLLIDVIESKLGELDDPPPNASNADDECNDAVHEENVATDITTNHDGKEPTSTTAKPIATTKSKSTFWCNECSQSFRNADRLAAHQRMHAGQKPEVCSICAKEFNSLRALRRHRLKHEDIKQFQCTQCSKQYKYQTSLTLHKKVHLNVARFVCDLCGKSFVRAHGLRSHLLSHTTETPFTCDVCQKQFKNQAMLRSHQLRHDGIKRFVCSYCGKKFTTSAELSIHNRSHTGK